MPAGILTDQTAGRQESTKNLLVQSASILFSQKGYRAATLDDIARACAIQRGSIFYHFPSKQAIAIAAIQYFHEQCEQHIFNPALNSNAPMSTVLRQLADNIEYFFVRRPDCDLINFIGLESTCISPKIGKMINDFFAAWHTMFKLLFEKLDIKLSQQNLYALFEQSMILIQGFCTVNRARTKRKNTNSSLGDYLFALWQENIKT